MRPRVVPLLVCLSICRRTPTSCSSLTSSRGSWRGWRRTTTAKLSHFSQRSMTGHTTRIGLQPGQLAVDPMLVKPTQSASRVQPFPCALAALRSGLRVPLAGAI
uniref:Uncharacterized protein n=1 Tax=uncultured marine virus TaxID=186617 RepID=A0A0F7KZU6_9VIRU|nr:hypothetical protein [uncultured marine virus]